MSAFLTICGFNMAGLDADLVGCGQPLYMLADVYRCVDCGVPFHKDCIKKHFSDGDVLTQEVIDEQLRRVQLRAVSSKL